MEVREHYDNVYEVGIWSEDEFDPRKLSMLGLILKKLRPRPEETLLDLGCGNGRYSKTFSLRGVSIVGLDISKLALDLAKRQCLRCNFVLGTAEKLPFRRGSFDKVFCLDVIEHVQNDSGCLYEIIRVTKGSGILFASFPKRNKIFRFSEDNRLGHIHVYQRNQIQEFFEENDLSTEICFVEGFFNFICYHLDMVGKRILTGKKVDPLKSSIKDGNLMVRLGRKILMFLASIDLIFCRFPLGNTFYVVAKRKVIS